eukprot:6319949-Pyramimonas_sp.AAC.1
MLLLRIGTASSWLLVCNRRQQMIGQILVWPTLCGTCRPPPSSKEGGKAEEEEEEEEEEKEEKEQDEEEDEKEEEGVRSRRT